MPSTISNRYADLFPLMERLEQIVRSTLSEYCRTRHFLLDARLKSLESVAGKIETGRYASWADIDDLVAATIVVPLKSDEKGVIAHLKDVFDVVQLKDRVTDRMQPSEFRFDSTRAVARVNSNPLQPVNQDSIATILFEVQIKTAFEHAWASATHALAYKTDTVSWERQRLASILRAAVEQLDSTIASFQNTSESIRKAHWPGISDQKQIVKALFSEFDEGRIPSELEPKDWSRFASNLHRIIASATGRSPRGDEPIKSLKKHLRVIREEVRSTGQDRIPRSISLFQFCVATLISRESIRAEAIDGYFLVTDELKSMYPEIEWPESVFAMNQDDVVKPPSTT